jgi:pyruvate oxidase
VYDEDVEGETFSELSDTYSCLVCGAPKSAFVPEGVVRCDESIKTNVADKIIEQLESFGVWYIYGIPGDSNLPLMEAIRKNENIKFILTRHEETAAFMASAHGKMTDHLGVCISIAGPGCTNLITGLMDAATDRSPLLVLAGQVPELYLGSEAFQEIDQLELFSSFAAYAETVSRANQALKLVLMAAKYAYKKPGVSVLSMPSDILSEKLDYPYRQVVCITGDSGFGMLMADFTTAVRERLAINVIVFNDGELKNIKKEQETDGYPEFGVSFSQSKLCRVCNILRWRGIPSGKPR